MAHLYKLDQSNNQGWNCPPFAKRLDWPNFRPMGDVINMETIRAGLQRAMKARRARATTLSLMVGTNRTLVKDLLEKTEDVRLSTLTKLAKALDVEVGDLLSADPPDSRVPSEQALQIVLAEVLGTSAGIAVPESKLRPTVAHLRLCLELLAKNPAIHASPDAIKAVVQAAAARPHEATPEA